MREGNIPESKIIWEEGGLEERIRRLESMISHSRGSHQPIWTGIESAISTVMEELQCIAKILGQLEDIYLRLDAGNDPIQADLDMGFNKIVGLAEPTDDSDAATKKYVDENAGGGGVTTLDELADVNVPAPEDEQVLTYDAGTETWIAADAPRGGGQPGGASGEFQTNADGEFAGTSGMRWEVGDWWSAINIPINLLVRWELGEENGLIAFLGHDWEPMAVFTAYGLTYIKHAFFDQLTLPAAEPAEEEVGDIYFDNYENKLWIYTDEGWKNLNDHGELFGLGDDDHTQYLTESRAATWHSGLAGQHVTNGNSHDHHGGDGAQVNHAHLANIGTRTHAEIDSHIAAAAPHGGHEVLSNKGAANGYAGLGGNGLVPTGQLGTGTANATTYLRGDQTWATIPSGGGGITRAFAYFVA